MKRANSFVRQLNPKRLRAGALVLILICALSIIGLLAYESAYYLVVRANNVAGIGGPNVNAEAAAPQSASGTPLPGDANIANNSNMLQSTPQLTPWDGVGRVTVLLLGLDYRDWQANEKYSRSDTMILLTLDPLNKTAGILSIPRDMWVAIPGFDHGKINTAYYLGDAYHLPGGGPGLAVKTVEQFLGVPINYYAQIDFDAFVQFIDELGGVKIDVPNKITIDLLGAGSQTKKTLQPGVQTLPGQWALAYARNRYTQNGDFDRARRQQQVIMGIRDRVLNLNMLPTLISKAPTLYAQLSAGIHTNLTVDDAVKLALLAKDIPKGNIKQGVFDQNYVFYGWSPDNLSILLPIPDKIHLLRDEIFTGSGVFSPQAAGDDQQRMQAEGGSLAVYNGSGATGLAQRTADYLKSQGANVTQVAEAPKAYAATTLVAHYGEPYLMKYLVTFMDIQPSRVIFQFDPTNPAQVELFLGNDWAQNNSLP
jgi:polyisoprenyl-teichoic acid--peptidoglycan teichoic acid transferase